MDEKIKGYRELTDQEIAKINEVKRLEADLVDLIEKLKREMPAGLQQRHLSLALTHLETGLMFLVKAIARPEGGLGG
jgi:hypothetical protein